MEQDIVYMRASTDELVELLKVNRAEHLLDDWQLDLLVRELTYRGVNVSSVD